MAKQSEDTRAIVTVTPPGVRTARKIVESIGNGFTVYIPKKYSHMALPGDIIYEDSISSMVSRIFHEKTHLVFVAPLGIAVRAMSKSIRDKKEDPAVVCVDHIGKFAISVLSGHLGGANRLCREIAAAINAIPVVTTGSDLEGFVSPDMFQREYNLSIEQDENLKPVLSNLLQGKKISILLESGSRDWIVDSGLLERSTLFSDISRIGELQPGTCIVATHRLIGEDSVFSGCLIVRPRVLVLGIGCSRGTTAQEIREAVDETFRLHSLSQKSISVVVSIDLKKDEAGLLEFVNSNQYEFVTFTREQLYAVEVPSPSRKVQDSVGTPSVAEASAILGSEYGDLIVTKARFPKVVLAVAIRRGA
ncbi:MAG: cobalamin biosynthesis protein [Thermoplasmatales archaeon]|nr:cobalamin biosynthesis protein [Thermoplasmatales archaeon]